MARSSSGLGRRPLKAEITSSNLVRATKHDDPGAFAPGFLVCMHVRGTHRPAVLFARAHAPCATALFAAATPPRRFASLIELGSPFLSSSRLERCQRETLIEKMYTQLALPGNIRRRMHRNLRYALALVAFHSPPGQKSTIGGTCRLIHHHQKAENRPARRRYCPKWMLQSIL